MKNVTITLEENVAKWAKVWAAKHDSSLSRMLGNELKTKMKLDQDYDRAKESFLSKKPKLLSSPRDKYPTRECLYD
jgi:hypothetical protein